MTSVVRRPAVGQLFTFEYPVCSRLGVPLEFIHRQIVVERVRDLLYEPLTLTEFLRDPLCRLGRFQIVGSDSGNPVTVYREAMSRRRLPVLILGLHDANVRGRGPLSFFPTRFAPTVAGRKRLAATIEKFLRDFPHKWTGNPFTLAVFPEAQS